MFKKLSHNFPVSEIDTILLKWNVSQYALMVCLKSLKIDTAENWAIRELATKSKWNLSLIADIDMDTDGEIYLCPRYARN